MMKKLQQYIRAKVIMMSISREQKSNQQQIQKNKRIKRILVVDDEYDVSLTMKVVLEQKGFKVDSFTDAS